MCSSQSDYAIFLGTKYEICYGRKWQNIHAYTRMCTAKQKRILSKLCDCNFVNHWYILVQQPIFITDDQRIYQ